MKYTNLIYQTNFNVSKILQDILVKDALHFGFEKNGKSNLNGFLNILLPNLIEYREDLHNEFLKYNNKDNKKVKLIEDNIYNVYLKTFDISEDAKVNIQIRINKENQINFLKIQNEFLQKYNVTFSRYIKTLLYEYASRPLFQRELFFIYKNKKTLLKAIKDYRYSIIYLKNNEFYNIVPIDVFVEPKTTENYIFGYTNLKDEIHCIKLSSVRDITISNDKANITEKDLNDLIDFEKIFIKK